MHPYPGISMGTMSEMASAGMAIVCGFMFSLETLIHRRLGHVFEVLPCHCTMPYFTITRKKLRKAGKPAAGQKKQKYEDRLFQVVEFLVTPTLKAYLRNTSISTLNPLCKFL